MVTAALSCRESLGNSRSRSSCRQGGPGQVDDPWAEGHSFSFNTGPDGTQHSPRTGLAGTVTSCCCCVCLALWSLSKLLAYELELTPSYSKVNWGRRRVLPIALTHYFGTRVPQRSTGLPVQPNFLFSFARRHVGCGACVPGFRL